MKQDVILVNTSRGPVIDEPAMVDALNSGKGELGEPLRLEDILLISFPSAASCSRRL